MKTILCVALILFAACQLAMAQSPLPETGIDNYCLTIWQCETEEQWVCGYDAWQAHQGALIAPQCGATWSLSNLAGRDALSVFESRIDNLCFISWACESEDEWVLGYHAYQAIRDVWYPRLRAAEAPPDAGLSTPETEIDNFCFTVWTCESEADWKRGFFAWQAAAGAWKPQQRGAERPAGSAAGDSGTSSRKAETQSQSAMRLLKRPVRDPGPVPQPLNPDDYDAYHDDEERPFILDCGTFQVVLPYTTHSACPPTVVTRQ